LNLNLPLNRYNSISITARKTRFSPKRFWGQPLGSPAAIVNFITLETHFSLFLAYALRYRKNSERLTTLNIPRVLSHCRSNEGW